MENVMNLIENLINLMEKIMILNDKFMNLIEKNKIWIDNLMKLDWNFNVGLKL